MDTTGGVDATGVSNWMDAWSGEVVEETRLPAACVRGWRSEVEKWKRGDYRRWGE